MMYLGKDENDKPYDLSNSSINNISGINDSRSIFKSEEKINELSNIIADQAKEIELLKFFTKTSSSTSSNISSSSKTIIKKGSNKDIGKGYLKTIEENGKIKLKLLIYLIFIINYL